MGKFFVLGAALENDFSSLDVIMSTFGNIRLLMPMITCVEESVEVRKLLDREKKNY